MSDKDWEIIASDELQSESIAVKKHEKWFKKIKKKNENENKNKNNGKKLKSKTSIEIK